MNLFLAIFWLVIGFGLLAWEWFIVGQPFLTVRGTGISLGWFALALAGYNLLRWWLGRIHQRDRQSAEGFADRRRRRVFEDPNPDFDFSGTAQKQDDIKKDDRVKKDEHFKPEDPGWFKKGE